MYNIDYNVDEKKLRREFETYGPIKKIKIVKDLEGKSRGYAFIEYEHKNDFKNAYKRSDRKRIEGRRVMVDFERARTSKRFLPRRLGGGKGNTRDFPAWLEEDMNIIRQQYSDIVFKPPQTVEEVPPHIEEQHKAEESDELLGQKRDRIESEEHQNGNDNHNEQQMEVDDDSSDSDSKRKKSKKDKKEKKAKKDKKEKKSKKDKKEKKEKKEKREPSVEIGEII